MSVKMLKIPNNLHSKTKELAKRDKVPLYRIVAEGIALYMKEHPEARELDWQEKRGRPKTSTVPGSHLKINLKLETD